MARVFIDWSKKQISPEEQIIPTLARISSVVRLSVQCALCRVKCAVCAVCSVQCALCTVKLAICSVQNAVFNVKVWCELRLVFIV